MIGREMNSFDIGRGVGSSGVVVVACDGDDRARDELI